MIRLKAMVIMLVIITSLMLTGKFAGRKFRGKYSQDLAEISGELSVMSGVLACIIYGRAETWLKDRRVNKLKYTEIKAS